MTKLFLVRHAETCWNREKRLQGQINTRLSKLGKQQAKKIAQRLKDEKFDAIYTSQLSRAIDTAKEINKFHNKKIILCPELNEIKFGIFEGLKREDVKKKHPKMYKEREKKIYTYRIKNGESFKDVWKRVNKILKVIIKKYPAGNVLVVGHGATKMLIIKKYLKKPFKQVRKERYHNTGI